MSIDLYNGDCLEIMDNLIEKGVKVDAIITDPPYGTTACKWDSVIPFEPMWGRVNNLIKDNGAICLFCTQPFTSSLISSNYSMFRYTWVWKKDGANGFLNCNYAPLKLTEDICVFSKGTIGSLSKNPIVYFPQGVIRVDKAKVNNPNSTYRESQGYMSKNNSLNSGKGYVQKYTNYPTNILEFSRDKGKYHPTQKPVALMEYLIKTYTNENETVLDFTMGSGSTGVACKNLGRNFIGIELDKNYFEIAKKRIEE